MSKSWLPWSAIEQIPQGMALEVTHWLNGRNPVRASMDLNTRKSKLRIKYEYLRVIVRGPAVLIWWPSKQAAEAIDEKALTDGRKIFPRNRKIAREVHGDVST